MRTQTSSALPLILAALVFLWPIGTGAAKKMRTWLGPTRFLEGSSLPSPRYGHGFTALNGRFYLMGGYGISPVGNFGENRTSYVMRRAAEWREKKRYGPTRERLRDLARPPLVPPPGRGSVPDC